MPEPRKVVLRSQLREGSGDLFLSDGGIRSFLPPPLEFPTYRYTVRKGSEPDTVRRWNRYKEDGVAYAGEGESIEIFVGTPRQQEPTENPSPGVLMAVQMVGVDNNHDADGPVVGSPQITAYLDGKFLFTTDPATIEDSYADRLREGLAGNNPGEADFAEFTADPVYGFDPRRLNYRAKNSVTANERWRLEDRPKVKRHIPTGTVVAEVAPSIWSALSWDGPPLTQFTPLRIVNAGSQQIGITGLRLRTAYGETTSVPYPSATPFNQASNFHTVANWRTELMTMPFAMTSISTLTVAKKIASYGRDGSVRWKNDPSTDTVTVSYEVYDGEVLVYSGTQPAFEKATHYRVVLDIDSPAPMEIKAVAFIADPKPRVPVGGGPGGGAGAVFVPGGGLGGLFGADFRANVPADVTRIMRHPLMQPGTGVLTQSGQACEWESEQFLILPSGTSSVKWSKGGGSPVVAQTPETWRDTAITWGHLEMAGQHGAPVDIEGSVGPINMPTYTPNVQVLVEGIDASLDLVQAGGLSASFLGDFAALTGGAGLDGGDFTIILDGVTVEWGKIVSYRASSNDEGVTVDVSAIDPLDYHNVDVEAVFVDDDPPNARADLSEYAYALADRVGLSLIDPVGASTLMFPRTVEDTLGEDEEIYSKYGHTITQELELVANSAVCTVISDPEERAIRFLNLESFGSSGAGGSGAGTPCSFVSRGYDLSQGYGMVEVSGVSNTLRVLTEIKTLPFVTQGADGLQEGTSITIPWFAGQGGIHSDEDRSGWFPGGPRNSVDGSVVDYEGAKYVDFQSRGKSGALELFMIPVSFNGGSEATPSEISLNDPGAPKLALTVGQGPTDSLRLWRVYNVTNLLDWGPVDTKGPPKLEVGAQGSGFIEITEIKFRVETPAEMRARLELTQGDIPDALGKCVTGFKCYIKDRGLYGYSVSFRLAFTATTIRDGSISLVPFICSPDEASIPVGKLPLKKVTVNNPFIVQERPKDMKAGEFPDLTGSAAHALGVRLANALTKMEARKRHAGSVKSLGGRSGRVGDSIEGMVIVEPPTAEIVPGDGCWTIFKTSTV